VTRYLQLDRSFREAADSAGFYLNSAVNTLIVVDIVRQQLKLYQGGLLVAVNPVSTSSSGAGCDADSGRTPTGWHIVREKIGDGQPCGTLFCARAAGPVVDSLNDDSGDDLITSRILWLGGVEHGLNLGGTVDSYRRYIYIHGTAQEHLVGRPVSHGCIRMNNRDVISLFERVSVYTPILISHCGN
jgi:hypothetical protein